jgi:hypothetical protein
MWNRRNMRREFVVQHRSRRPARANTFDLLRFQVTTGMRSHVLPLHGERHVWQWWRNSGN